MSQTSWTKNEVVQTDNFNYNLEEKRDVRNIESTIGEIRVQINSITQVFVRDLPRFCQATRPGGEKCIAVKELSFHKIR